MRRWLRSCADVSTCAGDLLELSASLCASVASSRLAGRHLRLRRPASSSQTPRASGLPSTDAGWMI
ncbi:hypothetical protein K466DRAFT_592660 [Polyporus arcularius HHB13444]|uniref:Uncharacterized protein n=1 Tax=Polyporus arcularius HHB13444 TaxID=1314778 RepID=A0A5C3NPE9_9APHY|nr:hypothetical protein K466DRAFT_592660 [Polyporus arcularius HHB13444]